MHQPSQQGGGGSASDIEIQAREILYNRAKLFELLGKHSGQPLERIEREFERDHWFSAAEAQRYGIIDNVIERPGELTPPALVATAKG
jgi:ATP-dependent Clp protease, protease subunit